MVPEALKMKAFEGQFFDICGDRLFLDFFDTPIARNAIFWGREGTQIALFLVRFLKVLWGRLLEHDFERFLTDFGGTLGVILVVWEGPGNTVDFQWISGRPAGPPKTWAGHGWRVITRILGPVTAIQDRWSAVCNCWITCNCWTDDSRPQLLNSWLQIAKPPSQPEAPLTEGSADIYIYIYIDIYVNIYIYINSLRRHLVYIYIYFYTSVNLRMSILRAKWTEWNHAERSRSRDCFL